MTKFTEGVMDDGAVILRDGEPVRIDEVVRLLNAAVNCCPCTWEVEGYRQGVTYLFCALCGQQREVKRGEA